MLKIKLNLRKVVAIAIYLAVSANLYAQKYHPADVAVINALIENNGLNEKTDNPASWWSFAFWNKGNPKQIIRLNLINRGLSGIADFTGLTQLEMLHCSNNNLSELNVTNCSNLQWLDCKQNNLTELNISGCANLSKVIYDDKYVMLITTEEDLKRKNERTFSVFSQNYIEQEINKWSQKGEFEKTADWEQRITGSSRETQKTELLKNAEQVYISEYSKYLDCNITLSDYDADKEVFIIKHKDGNWLLSVPVNEAQYFKNNWNNHIKTPQYAIVNDNIAFVGMKFTTANGNTYKCISKDVSNSKIYDVVNNNTVEQKDFSTQQSTPPNYNVKLKTDFERIGTNDRRMLEFFRKNKFSNYYEDFQSACKQRNSGKALLGVGITFSIVGLPLMISGLYVSNYDAATGIGLISSGSVLFSVGEVLTIVSIPVSASAGGRKRSIKNDFTRKYFDNSGYSYQPKLDFGLTANGVGITVNF